MKPYRKIGVLIIILLIVIQFVQPVKNKSESLGADDISQVYQMPSGLHQTLVTKCYDCHSNNTSYPWYFNIQPIGWWLAAHVHDGKEELNFSEFRKYDAEQVRHKLDELKEVTEEGSMPLKAYTIFHDNAELTEADKQQILNWIKTVAN
jgi:flavodoxin